MIHDFRNWERTKRLVFEDVQTAPEARVTSLVVKHRSQEFSRFSGTDLGAVTVAGGPDT